MEVEEGDDHGNGRVPGADVTWGKKEIEPFSPDQPRQIGLFAQDANQFIAGVAPPNQVMGVFLITAIEGLVDLAQDQIIDVAGIGGDQVSNDILSVALRPGAIVQQRQGVDGDFHGELCKRGGGLDFSVLRPIQYNTG